MLEHCGDQAGLVWASILTGTLLAVGFAFFALVSHKSEPKGLATPVLGFGWLAVGVIFSFSLYFTALLANSVAENSKTEIQKKLMR